MIQVSVVIVSYNARLFLKLCLESLFEAAKQVPTEVIVVDNASTDGAPEMVQLDFPQVHLIRNDHNLGFSKANNQGAAMARAKYVLLLNPDVVVGEDCLSRLWRFAEQKEGLGAVGLRYINGSGQFLPECKRNFPGRKVALNKLFGDGKGYYADQLDEFQNGEAEILAGAFLFLKRSVYQDHGGFDEDYFMFGEDIDLCHRIAESGLRNFYKGDQTILHFKGESSVKDYKYYTNFYGAMDIFYRKVYGGNFVWRILLPPIMRFMALVKLLKPSVKKAVDRPGGNLVYVGSREEVARKLITKFPDALVICSETLPKDWTGVEEVFYDSACLSMSEIIDSISRLGSNKLSKRIISVKGDHYLGSDSSASMGLTVLL